MKAIPGFIAQVPVGVTQGDGRMEHRARDDYVVEPQLVRLSCGNTFLDTTCWPFAGPAEYAGCGFFTWIGRRDLAEYCVYGIMSAHAPWCSGCRVTIV
jgi:hypothetical protein